MKISGRGLRQLFLALYVLVIIYFVAIGTPLTLAGASYSWRDDWLYGLLGIGLIVACQLIFLLGTGTKDLCRPIKRRRLIMPVLVASLMMAVLVGALIFALDEFFKVYALDNKVRFWVFLAVLGGLWCVWGFLFFVYSQNLERYQVLSKLTKIVLTGSLLELMVNIPAHVIVSRRPGCFVGLQTGIGLIAGLCVMMWAFGPGVILLFLRGQKKIQNQKLKLS